MQKYNLFGPEALAEAEDALHDRPHFQALPGPSLGDQGGHEANGTPIVEHSKRHGDDRLTCSDRLAGASLNPHAPGFPDQVRHHRAELDFDSSFDYFLCQVIDDPSKAVRDASERSAAFAARLIRKAQPVNADIANVGGVEALDITPCQRLIQRANIRAVFPHELFEGEIGTVVIRQAIGNRLPNGVELEGLHRPIDEQVMQFLDL